LGGKEGRGVELVDGHGKGHLRKRIASTPKKSSPESLRGGKKEKGGGGGGGGEEKKTSTSGRGGKPGALR